jgi:hypothetical protein
MQLPLTRWTSRRSLRTTLRYPQHHAQRTESPPPFVIGPVDSFPATPCSGALLGGNRAHQRDLLPTSLQHRSPPASGRDPSCCSGSSSWNRGLSAQIEPITALSAGFGANIRSYARRAACLAVGPQIGPRRIGYGSWSRRAALLPSPGNSATSAFRASTNSASRSRTPACTSSSFPDSINSWSLWQRAVIRCAP